MHFLNKLFLRLEGFIVFYIVARSNAQAEVVNHPNLSLLARVCGTINEDYVLSDKPSFEEFPWIALIFDNSADKKGELLHSGSLINSRYVLTVNERAGNEYNTSWVRIGEYNVKTGFDCEGEGSDMICASPPQDIAIEKVIISPGCDDTVSPCTNCIALLRLQKEVDFEQPNAAAICLPTASDSFGRNVTGVRGTLAGWRLSNHPNTLKKSRSTIISKDKCKQYIRTQCSTDRFPQNTICLKGSLDFETGAPFMVKTDHHGYTRYTQYGMLSTRLKDSDVNLFIDLTKYLKWILDSIEI